jgi:hypothetical protein
LALHISNRQLELEPVVGNVARSIGLAARTRQDTTTSEDKASTHWVVMGRTEEDVSWFADQSDWRAVRTNEARPWTDDYSNIIQPWLDRER